MTWSGLFGGVNTYGNNTDILYFLYQLTSRHKVIANKIGFGVCH